MGRQVTMESELVEATQRVFDRLWELEEENARLRQELAKKRIVRWRRS